MTAKGQKKFHSGKGNNSIFGGENTTPMRNGKAGTEGKETAAQEGKKRSTLESPRATQGEHFVW